MRIFDWLLSAGIHLVLLLGAGLVYIEQIATFDSGDGYDVRPRSALLEGGLFSEIPRVQDLPRGNSDSPSSTEADLLPRFDGGTDGFEPGFRWTEDNTCKLPPPPGSSLENLRRPYELRIYHCPRHSGACRLPMNGVLIHRDGWDRCRLCLAGGGSDSAVSAGLRWLARHQNSDGSWSAADFKRRCIRVACGGAGESDHDTGATSLALLAFLGAGYSQLSKDSCVDPAVPQQKLVFGTTVKEGLKWLLDHQDTEGCIGERGQKYLYGHAIATLALCEAYGLTSAEILRAPVQKAVDFLVAAQNPGKGWRYSLKCGDNDTSVTGWAVMALKSAELSGLSFPSTAYAGAIRWLSAVSDVDSRVGYTVAGSGKVYTPGRNEEFADHPTMTAIGTLSRIFMQRKRSEITLAAIGLLAADLPEWKPGKIDFYYWYYGSLALFHFDGPGGAIWKKWNESMKDALVRNQKTLKDGCENGSWDASLDRWGSEGGRVYATALNCMSMECYYLYPNVFGGGQK